MKKDLRMGTCSICGGDVMRKYPQTDLDRCRNCGGKDAQDVIKMTPDPKFIKNWTKK